MGGDSVGTGKNRGALIGEFVDGATVTPSGTYFEWTLLHFFLNWLKWKQVVGPNIWIPLTVLSVFCFCLCCKTYVKPSIPPQNFHCVSFFCVCLSA